jgi:hypothetical protein
MKLTTLIAIGALGVAGYFGYQKMTVKPASEQPAVKNAEIARRQLEATTQANNQRRAQQNAAAPVVSPSSTGLSKPAPAATKNRPEAGGGGLSADQQALIKQQAGHGKARP